MPFVISLWIYVLLDRPLKAIYESEVSERNKRFNKKQIDNSDKESYPDFHFHIQIYLSTPPALLVHIRNVLMKRQNILEQLCSFSLISIAI